MKIPPPNYTQIPNCILEETINDLNEGELRVLFLIMRQTFGWHKKWDWLTLQNIANRTHYDRRSVIRILKKLIEKKLVEKIIKGPIGSQRCWYSLVIEKVEEDPVDPSDGIETQEEMDEFKIVYTSDRRVTPPSDRTVTRPVTVRSPTKETITKEKAIIIAKPEKPRKEPELPKPAGGNNKISSEEDKRASMDLLEEFSPAVRLRLAKAYSTQEIAQGLRYVNHPTTVIEGKHGKIKLLQYFLKYPELYAEHMANIDKPKKVPIKEKILKTFEKGKVYSGRGRNDFEFSYDDKGPYFLWTKGGHQPYCLQWKEPDFERKWYELLDKLGIKNE